MLLVKSINPVIPRKIAVIQSCASQHRTPMPGRCGSESIQRSQPSCIDQSPQQAELGLEQVELK